MLSLYCRYPRDLQRLTFRATGRAGDVACDMVFDIDLTRIPEGDKEIRTDWAWQKAYQLIGEHARLKDPNLVAELKRLGRAHGIKIPYLDEIGQ